MKNSHIILGFFLIIFGCNLHSQVQSLPQVPLVVFFQEPVNCYNTGHIIINSAICPGFSNSPYQLDHIDWNMGDGTTITTNSFQVEHTYTSSQVFSVSAMAYFSLNGSLTGAHVVNTATGLDVTLPNLCASQQSSIYFDVPVQLLSLDLYTNPSSSVPLYTNTGISLKLDYQATNIILSNCSYQLLVDGISVAGPNLPLPLSGSVVYPSATYSEGQHVAEIIAINKLNMNCPVTATTIFEVLPPPDSIANCSDCFTFRPDRTKRYWLSAWVKEEVASQVKTYTNTSVKLTFNGSGAGVTTLAPTGEIIDGWQRIAGEFTVPANTTSIDIKLNNAGSIAAYFDDIRVHPFNASMKSYVNDPETFWLTAELDDNNYATFYEYDKEGKLIRIKKETAKGIMTIQESRTSNPKTN